MTEIKSAWEIALERTKDIEGDKETLKANKVKDEGKRLASAFLDKTEGGDEKDVQAKIKALSGEEQRWLRDGFFQVMIANVNLPTVDEFREKLSLVEKGMQLVIKEKKQVAYVFQQIGQFFEQYLQSRDQLVEGLKQQYEPQLREKERLLEQQMGAKVHLSPEQDPEFTALLTKNYSQLEEQYNNALRQAKDQLQNMFDSTK